MSKNKFCIIALALMVCIALVFTVTACRKEAVTDSSSEESNFSNDILSPHNIKSITVTVLPSPPHYKVITDEEEVNLICEAINETQKEEIFDSEKSGGWNIYLQFSDGTQVSLAGGSELKINDKKYKVENSLQSILLEIYNNSSAEEIES